MGRVRVPGKERQENWRASLVPAAAVIPTPRVCVRDAAVKKSVVVGSERGMVPSARSGGADGEHSIPGREMKCQDPWWTERGEGGVLVGAR